MELRLVAPDGNEAGVELLADTGNPFAVVISADQFEAYNRRGAFRRIHWLTSSQWHPAPPCRTHR